VRKDVNENVAFSTDSASYNRSKGIKNKKSQTDRSR